MKIHDETRFWNVRPMRWDGGRIAVARARSEGWRYMEHPDASYAVANWYHSKTIRLLTKARVTWVLLTWSEGFPESCEVRHRRQTADYIEKLKAAGIRATATIPMTEIADLDNFARDPELQFWLARDEDGAPRPCARDRTGRGARYKACLSQPGWRKHLGACAAAAVEARADAVLMEYTGGACRCGQCRDAFRKFTRDRLGREMEMSRAWKAASSPERLDEALAHFYCAQADEITEEVARACTRARTGTLYVCRTFQVADGSLPGESSGILAVAGLSRPGIHQPPLDMDAPADRNRKRAHYVTNAGVLALLAADRLGRPIQVSSARPSRARSAGEVMLSMAEAWAFHADYAPPVQGKFLTGLYFAERKALETLAGIREYYGFFRRHADLCKSAVSAARIAVLVSRDLRSADFLGWLAWKGLIFDARFIEGLCAAELQTYDLVLVPDLDGRVPALDENAWSVLDGFFAEGGVILLSDMLSKTPPARRMMASSPSGSRQLETLSFDGLRRNDPSGLMKTIRKKEEKPLIELKAPEGVMVRPMIAPPQSDAEGRFVMHMVNFRSRAVAELTIRLNLNRLNLRTIKALSPDAPMELRHSRFGGLLEMKCGPLLTYAMLSGTMPQ